MGRYRIWAQKTSWAYKDIEVDSLLDAATIADETLSLQGFTFKEDETHKEEWKIDVDEIERIVDTFTDVECTFYNDIDECYCVDAFNGTEDVVVAKIFDDGRVEYLDERAKTDSLVQEVINYKLKDLENEREIER